MIHSLSLVTLFVLFGYSLATIYFKETFDGGNPIGNRWVVSKWKQNSGEAGEWQHSGGLWSVNDRKGLRTTQDARFYSISAKLDKEFDNTGKPLVFSFSVKHEQKIDCGGGYAKLLPVGTDQENFNGDAPYSIMFGPDICGYSTKKVHAILNHNGQNLQKNSETKCPDDEYTHFYTLIVQPDDTYKIIVDGEVKDEGKLKEGWTFEKPKTIKDPDATKPSDWVDDEHIDDPNDVKPAGWDNEPEKVVDKSATKPEDWDDEDDGEWEAPLIDNPNYKGPWKAKRIKNPDFKGKWVHPEISNPDYAEEKDVYKRGKLGYVGIEIWQVKSGTVFGDFILTDSVEEYENFYNTQKVDQDAEKKAKEQYDSANKKDDDDTKPVETDTDDFDGKIDL